MSRSTELLRVKSDDKMHQTDARHVSGVSLTAFSSGGVIVKIRGSPSEQVNPINLPVCGALGGVLI